MTRPPLLAWLVLIVLTSLPLLIAALPLLSPAASDCARQRAYAEVLGGSPAVECR